MRDARNADIQSVLGAPKSRLCAVYPYRAYNFVQMAPVFHWISTPEGTSHRPVVCLLCLLSKNLTSTELFLSLEFQLFPSIGTRIRWHQCCCHIKRTHKHECDTLRYVHGVHSITVFGSTFSLSPVVVKERFLSLTMQVNFTVQQAGSSSFYH
jgi:hypothetical protein